MTFIKPPKTTTRTRLSSDHGHGLPLGTASFNYLIDHKAQSHQVLLLLALSTFEPEMKLKIERERSSWKREAIESLHHVSPSLKQVSAG